MQQKKLSQSSNTKIKFKPVKRPFKLCCNTCDGVHADDGIDVYFGTICPNHCTFCIAQTSKFLNEKIMPWCQKPDVPALLASVNRIAQETGKKARHLQIPGGEPLLFLRELNDFVVLLPTYIEEVVVQTSLPQCVFSDEQWPLLLSALSEIDTLMVSIHHPDAKKNAAILNNKTDFSDRFEGIKRIKEALPKLDIQVNTVFVNSVEWTPEDVELLIKKCDECGVSLLRLTEVMEHPNQWIPIAPLLGDVKFQSPYSHGCSTMMELDPPPVNGLKVQVKRNCFRNNPNCSASVSDLMKSTYRMFEWQLFHRFIKDYGVGIFPNGEVYNLHKE